MNTIQLEEWIIFINFLESNIFSYIISSLHLLRGELCKSYISCCCSTSCQMRNMSNLFVQK